MTRLLWYLLIILSYKAACLATPSFQYLKTVPDCAVDVSQQSRYTSGYSLRQLFTYLNSLTNLRCVKVVKHLLAHRAVAAACPRSSRSSRLVGCLTSRPVSRSRWCCHFHPGAGGDEYPSCPSPSQCTQSASCEGPAPQVSFLL